MHGLAPAANTFTFEAARITLAFGGGEWRGEKRRKEMEEQGYIYVSHKSGRAGEAGGILMDSAC